MNLYKFHSNPKQLIGYDVAFEEVPELAWEKYEYNFEELKKREHLWKQSAKYAYLYSYYEIKGRWVEGESIIATNAAYACRYASDVIKGRFPEGESAILDDQYYSYRYFNLFIRTNARELW